MRDYSSEFARVYRREIAPEAEQLEAKRRKRVRAFYRNIVLSVLVFAAIAAATVVFDLLQTHRDWVFFTGVLAVILAFLAISYPSTQHRKDVKKLVIQPICSLVGDLDYSLKAKGGFNLSAFRDASVVGNYNRSKLEDLFTGRYRDTGFAMVEARLRARRGQRSSRTVFKGLLFDIEVPKPFTCYALMVGDKGAFANMILGFVRERFSGVQRVESGHPDFEERFELYSDDPAGALNLLSGGFFDAMVALNDAVGRRSISAAMTDQRFLLAMPLDRNLFEVGRLHRPLDHLEEDLEEILREVTIPHRVIDYLHGERPELLP